jgi:hypothetical protein
MQHRYENQAFVAAPASAVFAFLDDPSHLTSHMSKSSWMMGGGAMSTTTDEGKGQSIGSHIRLNGRAFGLSVYLDEVISRREPPRLKEWRTVGPHRLLVVGDYIMGFELKAFGQQTQIKIYIDYDLPQRHAWLGKLLGSFYARLCVDKMLRDARRYFGSEAVGGRALSERHM